jgi:hypothetical protein
MSTRPVFADLSAPNTTVLNLEQPNSAASKVLVTGELLEQILLCLSAQDLLTISGVNPIFNDCVRSSPKAQVKLFLRPSGEPQQIWYKSTYRGEDEFTATVDRLRNLAPDERDPGYWLDPPLPMTKLCPLLQCIRGPENWFYLPGPRSMVITAGLDDLERFGDMVLTDPPCYSAHCRLYYRYSVEPTCWVEGQRSVNSKSPLTMRNLLDRTFRQQHDTHVRFPDPGPGNAARDDTVSTSFQKAIDEQCRLRGDHFELAPKLCSIQFHDLNFASSEYWTYMEDKKRAELEKKAPASKEG